MISPEELLKALPYGPGFLFADRILQVDDRRIEGICHFEKDHPACRGHFRDDFVLPGVIILEALGQIALVAHALFLSGDPGAYMPVLHSISVDFHLKVPLDQPMAVIGEPVYFRNRLIRSNMRMLDEKGTLYVSANGLLKLIPKNT